MATRDEIVAIMNEVLETPVRAGVLSFEDWSTGGKLPYDEQQLQRFADVFAYYDAHGTGGNSLTLRSILGREPRTLRQYIRELAK